MKLTPKEKARRKKFVKCNSYKSYHWRWKEVKEELLKM